MIRSLPHLWRHHPFALSFFGLAAVLALVFAVRLTLFSVYWADPAHRQQHPEGWMTPGYVAHSWHLPPEEVFRELGLTPPADRMTLERIAADKGMPLEALIATLAAYLNTRTARP
ncbi:hypothetical protein ACRARG_01170 [Pseudooceanicola sp. C21-150M6]|uniref:hypothetical protein n=1 Tax=Pseudooceanicola sp. C21-150M6 TaxID=3434355 RepID=UPI003D7F9C90